MGDKVTMMLLLLVVAGVVGGLIYYFVLPKGNDVRKIDPANQERPKASHGSASKPIVAKTAQLSALRERLADAQTTTTGLKKMPPKAAEPVKAPEPEKSWRPEEAGLGESHVVVAEPAQAKPIAPTTMPMKPKAEPVVARQLDVPALPKIQRPEPAAQVAIPVQEPVVEPKEPIAPLVAAATPAVHILLVDDSKVVRVKTEKLLLNKGYIVTTAIDGIDALAKLETLKPAIIITDIEMPNLDGFGLVRNVRGNMRTAEIPVIVMTSHVNLHLDIAATEGINGFLPKPFNDQDLLDQVAFLCES